MTNPFLISSVLTTLAYFDVRGLPLTAEELEFYLWKPPRLAGGSLASELRAALADLKTEQKIDELYGLWFLAGRAELVEKRRAAGLITEQKLRRARRGARILTWIPFVRAVFVCNSVAEERANAASDIDLFIITAPRRIWIARLGANLILKLFGLRTTGRHERDRLCLSYFIGADHLNLAATRVAPEDVHLAYWVHSMIPVFDPENFYERLIRANEWTASLIPALQHSRAAGLELVPLSKVARWWTAIWEAFWRGAYGNIIEGEAKKIQMDLLNRRLNKKINNGDRGVIIDNGIIKLHEQDSRAEVRNAWLQKIKHYGI